MYMLILRILFAFYLYFDANNINNLYEFYYTMIEIFTSLNIFLIMKVVLNYTIINRNK